MPNSGPVEVVVYGLLGLAVVAFVGIGYNLVWLNIFPPREK